MKTLLVLSISLLVFGCHSTKETGGAVQKRPHFLGGRGGAGGTGQADGSNGRAGENGKGGLNISTRQ